jgi:hypothetical protein
MLSARKQLDVFTAYRRVGTYRGAAEICGVTHKTVKRIVENGQARAERVERRKNYESVRGLVAEELRQTRGQVEREAAAAAGAGGRLRGFGSQLPPPGGAGAQQVPPGSGGLGCR